MPQVARPHPHYLERIGGLPGNGRRFLWREGRLLGQFAVDIMCQHSPGREDGQGNDRPEYPADACADHHGVPAVVPCFRKGEVKFLSFLSLWPNLR